MPHLDVNDSGEKHAQPEHLTATDLKTHITEQLSSMLHFQLPHAEMSKQSNHTNKVLSCQVRPRCRHFDGEELCLGNVPSFGSRLPKTLNEIKL